MCPIYFSKHTGSLRRHTLGCYKAGKCQIRRNENFEILPDVVETKLSLSLIYCSKCLLLF